MKKIISVLLLVAMLLALAACGESGPQSTQPSDTFEGTREVVIGITTDMKVWDPWASFNAGRQEIMPIIYQTLAADIPDPENGTTQRYWTMCTGYEKIDANTYEVYLRDGIYDTAGYPFTAEDAVFSYEMAKAGGTLAQMNAIDHLEVVNKLTFRMITGSTLAMGDFEDLLVGFNMVTKESYEASPDAMVATPVGTTGYVLQEYVAGSHATFVKADKYWNDAANESKSIEDGYTPQWDNTAVDVIRYEIITDTTTLCIALEDGEIDIASGISVSDLTNFTSGSNEGKFNYYGIPENYFSLGFNTAPSSPTSNWNLRMALALAVDSAGVLDLVYDGDGMTMKAWSFPSYKDYLSEWDNQDYFEYDLEQAKQYLEKYYQETGTSANDLKLRLICENGAAEYEKTAEAIQLYLVKLTGNSNCVEIISCDRATYKTAYSNPNEFDLIMLNCQSTSRSYVVYNWNLWANGDKLLHGDDIFNTGSEEFKALIYAAVGEETHSNETVAAVQDYLNENALIKALICGNAYMVSANWISGLEHGIGAKTSIGVCSLDYDWSQSGK